METSPRPCAHIPSSDGALLRALERCRDGAPRGPCLTLAFRNSGGEIFRIVEAAGLIEATRIAQESARLGFQVESPIGLEPRGGYNGIFRAAH